MPTPIHKFLRKINLVNKIIHFRRVDRLRSCFSRVSLPENPKVIDIGCGIDGRSVSDHLPINWEITGVDLHEPANICHTHPNFTYKQASATNLSFAKDKEFDLAISVGMLEHILDDDYKKNC